MAGKIQKRFRERMSLRDADNDELNEINRFIAARRAAKEAEERHAAAAERARRGEAERQASRAWLSCENFWFRSCWLLPAADSNAVSHLL